LICVRRDLDDHADRSDGSRLNSGPEGREWIHLARDRSTRGSEALGASTVPLSVTLATWVPTPAGRDEQQQQRHSKGVQLETTAGSVAERGSRAWALMLKCYCLQGAGGGSPQRSSMHAACSREGQIEDPLSWGANTLFAVRLSVSVILISYDTIFFSYNKIASADL